MDRQSVDNVIETFHESKILHLWFLLHEMLFIFNEAFNYVYLLT